MKISQIIRALYVLTKHQNPEHHLNRLEKLKSKAEKSDILFDGTLDKLIKDGSISSQMASSLTNDSLNIALISKKLIEAGELIYIKQDTLHTEEIEELITP